MHSGNDLNIIKLKHKISKNQKFFLLIYTFLKEIDKIRSENYSNLGTIENYDLFCLIGRLLDIKDKLAYPTNQTRLIKTNKNLTLLFVNENDKFRNIFNNTHLFNDL